MAVDAPKRAVGKEARKKRGFPAPREHGSWGMLGTSVILASAVAGFGLVHAMLMAAILLVMFCREPLYVWYRRRGEGAGRDAGRWALRLGGAALVFYLLAWLAGPSPWLLGAGLLCAAVLSVYPVLRAARADRTAAGEFLGIIGMTAVAPILILVSRPDQLGMALVIWALSALHYGSAVYFIKMKVHLYLTKERGERPKAGPIAANLAYQVFLVVLLFLWGPSLGDDFLPWAAVAFGPNVIKSTAESLRPPKLLNFKFLGFREIGFGLVFTLGVLGWLL